jgi:hypothetical protein
LLRWEAVYARFPNLTEALEGRDAALSALDSDAGATIQPDLSQNGEELQPPGLVGKDVPASDAAAVGSLTDGASMEETPVSTGASLEPDAATGRSSLAASRMPLSPAPLTTPEDLAEKREDLSIATIAVQQRTATTAKHSDVLPSNGGIVVSNEDVDRRQDREMTGEVPGPTRGSTLQPRDRREDRAKPVERYVTRPHRSITGALLGTLSRLLVRRR